MQSRNLTGAFQTQETTKGRGLVAMSLDSKTIRGAAAIDAQNIRGSQMLRKPNRSRHAAQRDKLFATDRLVTNLGRLPTLGLNQIKLEEIEYQDNNLFRI